MVPTLLCLKIYTFNGTLLQEGGYFLAECLTLDGILLNIWRLKNALVPASGASSNPKRASTMWTTG